MDPIDVDDSDTELEQPTNDRPIALNVDELCIRVQQKDPYARTVLENHIKTIYRDNNGLSIKTSALLPTDLKKLTDDELVNVCDNLIAQRNRTKKNGMATKIISCAASVARLATHLVGYGNCDNLFEKINEDVVLRDSVIEAALGKNISPKPAVTAAICVADYLASFCATLIENGKHRAVIRAALEESRNKTTANQTGEPSDN